MIACIDDIDCWLACHMLKLNPAQSEFLWTATARRLPLVDNRAFHLGNGDVYPSPTMGNLGAFYYSSCSMVPHIDSIRAEFYHLHCLHAIRLSDNCDGNSARKQPRSDSHRLL